MACGNMTITCLKMHEARQIDEYAVKCINSCCSVLSTHTSIHAYGVKCMYICCLVLSTHTSYKLVSFFRSITSAARRTYQDNLWRLNIWFIRSPFPFGQLNPFKYFSNLRARYFFTPLRTNSVEDQQGFRFLGPTTSALTYPLSVLKSTGEKVRTRYYRAFYTIETSTQADKSWKRWNSPFCWPWHCYSPPMGQPCMGRPSTLAS